MAYRKNTYEFKNAIEVEEYHSARYGAPGMERQKKRKATPEQMEKINQYNKEKKARRKLRTHFDVNDYFSDLTYAREARPPDMQQAKEDFKAFVGKVRREYQKRGAVLKWMRNIEVGTKGAWHIHIVLNRIPDTDLILKKAWPHGKVVNQLLHEKGEFAALAKYITKTPATEPRIREASYSASRNLPLKPPERKIYRYWTTWRDIRIPEGFYLDPESYHEGENPVTRYPYRIYTLLRVRRE